MLLPSSVPKAKQCFKTFAIPRLQFPIFRFIEIFLQKFRFTKYSTKLPKNLSWDNIPTSYRRQLSNVKFLTEIFLKKGCSFDKHHPYDQNLTRKHIGRSRHAQVYKQKKKLSCNFSLHWKASKALHDGYFATEFKRTNLKCTLNYSNVNVDII